MLFVGRDVIGDIQFTDCMLLIADGEMDSFMRELLANNVTATRTETYGITTVGFLVFALIFILTFDLNAGRGLSVLAVRLCFIQMLLKQTLCSLQ